MSVCHTAIGYNNVLCHVFLLVNDPAARFIRTLYPPTEFTEEIIWLVAIIPYRPTIYRSHENSKSIYRIAFKFLTHRLIVECRLAPGSL